MPSWQAPAKAISPSKRNANRDKLLQESPYYQVWALSDRRPEPCTYARLQHPPQAENRRGIPAGVLPLYVLRPSFDWPALLSHKRGVLPTAVPHYVSQNSEVLLNTIALRLTHCLYSKLQLRQPRSHFFFFFPCIGHFFLHTHFLAKSLLLIDQKGTQCPRSRSRQSNGPGNPSIVADSWRRAAHSRSRWHSRGKPHRALKYSLLSITSLKKEVNWR